MTAREYIISKHPELADKNRIRIMDIDDLVGLLNDFKEPKPAIKRKVHINNKPSKY